MIIRQKQLNPNILFTRPALRKNTARADNRFGIMLYYPLINVYQVKWVAIKNEKGK